MSSPAFKEWQVIVHALGTGRQSLILRKGGIAEGRDGFQLEHRRFWLFPTRFHAQLEKLKPAARDWLAHAAADTTESTVTLRYYAELTHAAVLTDWVAVTALDDLHHWSEPTIRERFASSQPPSLHALLVRVHRAPAPITLSLTPEMGGCKSWITLPVALPSAGDDPVLGNRDFTPILSRIPR